MANIAPPKENKNKTKTKENKTVVHLKSNAATLQTPPDAIKPLQLKIPESSKNEFKAYASIHGKTMAHMFLDMFEEHKQNHA